VKFEVLKTVIIKNRADSPYVLLDVNEGYGEITGKSYPPDVSGFYNPLIEWFENFKEDNKKEFELSIKLDYINTASLKLLMDLMYKIEEVSDKGKKILIKWFYPDDDPEMLDLGEEFERLINLQFQHICYHKEY
jgi:hypothetical protein